MTEDIGKIKAKRKSETLGMMDIRYYQCPGCKSWQSRPSGHNPVCPKCETTTILYPELCKTGKAQRHGGGTRYGMHDLRRGMIIRVLRAKNEPMTVSSIVSRLSREEYGYRPKSFESSIYKMVHEGELSIVGIGKTVKYTLRDDLR